MIFTMIILGHAFESQSLVPAVCAPRTVIKAVLASFAEAFKAYPLNLRVQLWKLGPSGPSRHPTCPKFLFLESGAT